MKRVNLKDISKTLNEDFGLQIFRELLGGVEPKHKKVVRLFDMSKHSSDTFYDKTAKKPAHVKNYKDGGHYYAVDAYMHAHNFSDDGDGWANAVMELAKEYGLLPIGYGSKLYEKRKYTAPAQPEDSERASCNRLANPKFYTEYSAKHLEFWQKFGVGEELLRKYNVAPLKGFDLLHLETGESKTIELNEIAFGYQLSDVSVKKYQPFSENKKFKWQWVGEYPKKIDAWGVEQLPSLCKTILIVEGLKDCIAANAMLNQFDIYAIGLDSASSNMSAMFVENLALKAQKIVLCLDNDPAGEKANKKNSDLHKLAYLPYKETTKAKDFADLVCTGIEASAVLEWIATDTVEYISNEKVKSLEGVLKFWYINDKGTLCIDVKNLVLFFQARGLRGYKTTTEDGTVVDDMLVMMKDKIIREVRIKELKLMIKTIIEDEFPDEIEHATIVDPKTKDVVEVVRTKEQLLGKLMSGDKIYFSKFDWLEEIPENFNKDTENASFIYFKNCVLKIERVDGKVVKKVLDYASIDGYVWDKQIIKRDFAINNDITSADFFLFLKNISGGGKKMKALMQIMGYLIHNHKAEGYQKSVIFSDEGLELGSKGGRGKGLFFKALGKVRNVAYIKGEGLNMEGNHLFQRVTINTDIVLFDDVEAKFNFRKLFTEITEGMTVNRKNKDEFFLDYNRAPKIAITTNFVVEGAMDSHERRKLEFEVKPYYNKDNTPVMEFGRTFFTGWDDEEWARFYNVMAQCVAEYFLCFQGDTPNIVIENENTNRRKLLHYCEKHAEFPQWADDNIVIGTEYIKKELYERFCLLDDDYKLKLGQRKFTDYLTYYAKTYNGWEVHTENRNSVGYIRFFEQKSK